VFVAIIRGAVFWTRRWEGRVRREKQKVLGSWVGKGGKDGDWRSLRSMETGGTGGTGG
jgi:hypothetical protein